MSAPLNPIEAAFAVTPSWMLTIRNFDAIEVHPCCVVGFADGVDMVETCEPEDAHFWSVYGHYVTADSIASRIFQPKPRRKLLPQGSGAPTRILPARRGHDAPHPRSSSAAAGRPFISLRGAATGLD